MDIYEIENTIKDLEDGNTTYDSCMKLASLYTVREHLVSNIENDVVKEYKDILPEYYNYKILKQQFQRGEVNQERVLTSLKVMCKEINEFINILLSSADIQEEYDILKSQLMIRSK